MTDTLRIYLYVNTTAPTVNDDGVAGYAVGDRWLDTVADKEYVLLDATEGAAVWRCTTPAYGSCYGNEIAWSQATAAQNTWYNISDADMADGSGGLSAVTHDGNGLLTVTNAGRYLITFSISAECSVANKHVQVGIEVNSSGTAVNDGIVHKYSLTASEQFTLASTLILDLSASDTIEASIRTTDTGTPNLNVDHLNITVIQI